MGGNALAHLGVGRADTRTVINLYNRICRLGALYGMRLHLVPWVEEKDDHGDIDVLTDYVPGGVACFMKHNFGIAENEMSTNGNVISVAVPYDSKLKIQVDFITTPDEDMPFSMFYYAGGDLGSLVGRIAAAKGYTFATNGFRLRADHERGILEDIKLPVKMVRALDLLGFKTMPDAETFKTYHNMWTYVMSSELVHPAMFMPDATNSENRSRDKQRRMIGKFQDWIRSQYPDDCEKLGDYQRFTGAERLHCMPEDLSTHAQKVLAQRERDEENRAGRSACYGRKAVFEVFGTLSNEDMGAIIREMQPLLPTKNDREDLWKLNKDMALMLSKNAARAAGLKLGFNPR